MSVKDHVEEIMSSKDRLEVDSVIASIIILARQAKRMGDHFIIGFEKSWIPGYDKNDPEGLAAMNPLVNEIESLKDLLEELGLDNVIFVPASGDDLAGRLIDKANDVSTALSNIVVLASETTVDSDSFKDLRSTSTERKAFLAGVDTSEISKAAPAGQVNFVDVVRMLSTTLELARGKPARDPGLIKIYDKKLRKVIFLPGARPMDIEDIQKRNNMSILALKMA